MNNEIANKYTETLNKMFNYLNLFNPLEINVTYNEDTNLFDFYNECNQLLLSCSLNALFMTSMEDMVKLCKM